MVNLRAFYAREVIGYVLPLPELPWGFNRVFKYIGFYAVGVLLAGRETRIVDRKIRTGMVAIVLLIVNFFLSCYHLTMEIMWFVTALIGVAANILGSDPLTIFLQNVDLLRTCALGVHYI